MTPPAAVSTCLKDQVNITCAARGNNPMPNSGSHNAAGTGTQSRHAKGRLVHNPTVQKARKMASALSVLRNARTTVVAAPALTEKTKPKTNHKPTAADNAPAHNAVSWSGPTTVTSPNRLTPRPATTRAVSFSSRNTAANTAPHTGNV